MEGNEGRNKVEEVYVVIGKSSVVVGLESADKIILAVLLK